VGMTFPITDFMSDDYAPPYRAALRPTDFEFFDGSDVGGDVAGYWGWRVRGLARDGSPCDYVIANAYCFDPFEDDPGTEHPHFGLRRMESMIVSGEPPVFAERLQHPFTRELEGEGAVDDWVWEIQSRDAEGRDHGRQSRWAGDDLESMVGRAEWGIVAYSTHEVSLRSLWTRGDLRRWFTSALAGTQVSVEFADVTRMPAFESRFVSTGAFLRDILPDGAVPYRPILMSTEFDRQEWMAQRVSFARDGGDALHSIDEIEPIVWTNMSGSEVLSCWATKVLLWSELVADAEIDRHPQVAGTAVQAPQVSDMSPAARDADDATSVGEWLAIHVIGTDAAIVVPTAYTLLEAKVDNDGATVTFSAHESGRRTARNRRRARFEAEWGEWLDEHVTLTDEQIDVGIARAEAIFRDALAKEEK